jgi:hypothetical protein
MRNRGELAEGWYDPTTKQRAIASAIPPATATHPTANRRPSPDYGPSLQSSHLVEGSDEDDFGPAVPTQMQHPKRAGPAIPSMQDLQLRDGKLCSSLLHSLTLMNVHRAQS